MIISGQGSTAQQFKPPTFPAASVGYPIPVVNRIIGYGIAPAARGAFTFAQYGLAQWIMLGPATFDTLPCGRPFRTAPPDQIAFDCSVTSNPTVAGQQIIVEDANGAVLERWEVINVAEVPFGRMIPVWRGTAYQQPAAGSIAPFKITASNFGPGDAWSLTIAG